MPGTETTEREAVGEVEIADPKVAGAGIPLDLEGIGSRAQIAPAEIPGAEADARGVGDGDVRGDARLPRAAQGAGNGPDAGILSGGV